MVYVSINLQTMTMPSSVKYNGNTYYLQSNGRYYIADLSRKNGKRVKKLLHRKIWEDSFGTIPDGYDVHHKDEDWTNNALDNLEIMHGSLHQSMHMKERWQHEEFRAKTLNHLESIRDKASDWHKSEEGRKWHSEMQKNAWKNKTLTSKQCKRCNKMFETPFPTRTNFCSRACSQYEFIKTSERLTKECKGCGSLFEHSKHHKRSFCNKSCSAKHHNEVRKLLR